MTPLQEVLQFRIVHPQLDNLHEFPADFLRFRLSERNAHQVFWVRIVRVINAVQSDHDILQ